jgi:hypothetical protein
LLKNTRVDVKILGSGELTKKLAVSAHGFSKSARAKIEAAGGSVVWLRGEPVEKKPKVKARKPVAADLDDDVVEETRETVEAAEPDEGSEEE